MGVFFRHNAVFIHIPLQESTRSPDPPSHPAPRSAPTQSPRGICMIDLREASIPHQLEIQDAGTTDAAAMQISRIGIPAG